MTRASIIIATHNHDHLVSEAIDSALAQTQPCEVVVVDDGSTDNTHQVLQSYGDRILRLVQANAGQGTAISRGIALATGDVLVLLDADDMMEATRVEHILDALKRHPEAQWVRHGLRLADSEGRILDHPPLYMAVSDPRADIASRGRTAGTTSVLALRRRLWDVIGPIPSGYTGYADLYLLVASGLVAGHVHIAKPLSIRRLHRGQHFTLDSADRQREALFHVQLRADISRDAARIAHALGGPPDVANGGAWWQLVAELDVAKAERRLRTRDLVRLVPQLVIRLAGAPLPPAARVLTAVRAMVLAVSPHALFLRLWWSAHEGRRRSRWLA